MTFDANQVLRIRIPHNGNIAIGPGKAALLESIRETGSISAAGRQLEMSYRKAWLLVDQMNQCFAQPLVEASKGGSGGGGARVTELGLDVLNRYRQLEALAWASIVPGLAALEGLLGAPVEPGS